jgi:transcriptional regulator with XRE-family HTH domain
MLKPISTPIGPMLRALRAERKISQAELGSRIGISQSHIQKIESGTTDVRLSTLQAILQSLGYDLAVGDPLAIRAARVLDEPRSRGRFE